MGSKCGRALAVAVHDLRTPLAVITGYLGLLGRQYASTLSRHQRELLANIEKAADSLTTLVSQLSDLSSLENQTLALRHQPIKLAAIVKETSAEVARDVGGKIVLRGAMPRASLVGDEQRLRAAFGTLFTAALRESKPPQTIVVQQVVRSARSGASALIAVGEKMTVEMLLKVPPRQLTGYDAPNGARNLAAVVACHVIRAHGGHTWMLRRHRKAPGVMVGLPLQSS
jgi:K+-sensing histidine kinase KdpD